MSQHTLGPWSFCGNGPHQAKPCACGCIFGDGGQVYVAKTLTLDDSVDPVASERQRDANTRLIAAAPELLDALEFVLPMLRDEGEHEPEYQRAVAVIAKAKGTVAGNDHAKETGSEGSESPTT